MSYWDWTRSNSSTRPRFYKGSMLEAGPPLKLPGPLSYMRILVLSSLITRIFWSCKLIATSRMSISRLREFNSFSWSSSERYLTLSSLRFYSSSYFVSSSYVCRYSDFSSIALSEELTWSTVFSSCLFSSESDRTWDAYSLVSASLSFNLSFSWSSWS